MLRRRGRMWMKTLRTQGAILCVSGLRKWMFSTRTVTQMLKVSRIMVKRTNLPRRGTTREVGGMISASRRKNTVRERRMLMERLTLTKTVLFNLHNISIHWLYVPTVEQWTHTLLTNILNIINSTISDKPSPRCQTGGRTRGLWGSWCPCRGWWGWRCRRESSSSWWCWRWCPGKVPHSRCRTWHSSLQGPASTVCSSQYCINTVF